MELSPTPGQNSPQPEGTPGVPPPVLSQPPEPPGKKMTGATLVYFLIFINILVLGTLGYWFYRQGTFRELFSQTKSTPTAAPTAAVSPTATPTPSPSPQTAIPTDWKTYRNTNCAYEISYPANWFLTETTRGDECQGGSNILTSYQPPEVQIKDPDFFKGKLKIDIGRFIQTKPADQSLEEWLGEYEKKLETAGMTTIISQEVINLSGKKTIRQVKSYMNNQGIDYYIENKNYVYFISAGGDFSENQAIFDQILSTFKFLEENQSP